MRPVYLDHNATTPVAPEVLEAMIPALRDLWGNPSSAHAYGRQAREAVDRARAQVASLLCAAPDEILFTSGGTESDNAAIVGVAEATAHRGRHLVISAVEHAAIEKACAYLETRGWEVTRVPVSPAGRVEAQAVAEAVRADTTLVSVVHANNETGVIQPVREIGERVRPRGVVLHTDAAQSAGKIPTRVDELQVDLLTVAGHKLYAPKGVGVLYVRSGTPFAGFLRGAAHEAGRRAGTENTAGIVALGAACALAERESRTRAEHLAAMRDRLEAALRRRLPDLVVHGSGAPRLPNTLSIAFPGAEAIAVVARLTGVATAAGAACHSGKSEPSRMLRAMGVPDALAIATLRLTTGRGNTAEEMDLAAEEVAEVVRATRRGRDGSAG